MFTNSASFSLPHILKQQAQPTTECWSRPTLMSLSTFMVQIQWDGGKPGCSYRAFQSQKLIIPCDPGSQSGRPGRLSPNLSDPWTGQISSGPESPGSHLGSTRQLGGELNKDLYILLFDLQKEFICLHDVKAIYIGIIVFILYMIGYYQILNK